MPGALCLSVNSVFSALLSFFGVSNLEQIISMENLTHFCGNDKKVIAVAVLIS